MRDWRKTLRQRLAGLELPATQAGDVVEELAQHAEERYADFLSRGIAAADAERMLLDELDEDAALRLVLERRARRSRPAGIVVGDSSRASRLHAMVQDVRYGLRSLRSRPGFTAAALLTLALGIGANTLIFSVLNAVLLRPLPFHEPDQLITYFGTAPEKGLPEVAMPDGLFLYHREHARTMMSLAAFQWGGFNLDEGDEPERIDAAYVTSDFFAVLGVRLALGREFTRSEEVPSGGLVTILGDDIWRRRFGADSGIIGRTIRLNGLSNTIIGIAPPGFEYPGRSRVWVPLRVQSGSFNCWCSSTVARLKSGRTPEDASRDVARMTDEFGMQRRDIFPDAKPGGARVVTETLANRLTGDLRTPLLVLAGAVGVVLLIACANVANLLLSRATQRAREMAVRCCLGASPRRIAAQLMTESLLLSVLGSSIGLALAMWGMRAVRALPRDQIPRVDEVALDPVVLLFTAGTAVLTAILFGLAPALRSARVDLQARLRDGVRGTASGTSRRLAGAFVVSQIALSVVLLSGSLLLLRSFQRLMRIDPGFRSENVLTARLQVPYQRHPSDTALRLFYASLLERVRSLPGVMEAGITSRAPFSPGNMQNNIIVEGREPRPGEPVLVANIRFVSQGYFAAIGTPILRGRAFTDADGPNAPRVAIVDETLVQRYWPGQDPIGKRVRHGGDPANNPWLTIVGVVPNVKHARLDEDASLQVYEPYAQQSVWGTTLVVRAAGRPENLVPSLRTQLKAVDPTVPLYEVRTMAAALASSLGTRTLTSGLLLGFAAVAVLLAAIGIYGVTSLNVNGRTREFGVRMALGARPVSIMALVLRQGVALAAIGVVAGVACAFWLMPLLRDLLVGVRPFDPVTFAMSSLGLTGIAILACLIPARRATRADPTEAMRSE